MRQANETILVTGGAGFIGSNFVLSWMKAARAGVVNLDLLTYAGNAANLAPLEATRGGERYTLVRGDICDAELVGSLLRKHRPRAVVHFAAESHVDRSIVSPEAFIRTNVQGTFVLLEQARAYWTGVERRRAGGVPVFARVDGRGVWDAGAGRCGVQRDDCVCAEQSLCGVEGRIGSFGAGVLSYLRTAGPDHELLEQLRTVPVSGEIDSADDSERAGGQAAAGVRRRKECARLAVCGRSLRGHPGSAGKRAAGRDVQRGREQRAGEYRRGDGDLRSCGRDAAKGRRRAAPEAHHLRARPAGARPALCHRREEDCARAELEAGGGI